jgi:hypothetical protein
VGEAEGGGAGGLDLGGRGVDAGCRAAGGGETDGRAGGQGGQQRVAGGGEGTGGGGELGGGDVAAEGEAGGDVGGEGARVVLDPTAVLGPGFGGLDRAERGEPGVGVGVGQPQ